MLLPEDEPPLAPPVLLGLCVEDEPLDPDEPVVEPPMPLLDEPEDGLWVDDDVPPVALDFWPASHSERESLPSWSLSSLSNCASPELDEDDEPPAADEDELEGEDEELPPAAEGEVVDDLLPCDIEGEALEPEELLEESAA